MTQSCIRRRKAPAFGWPPAFSQGAKAARMSLPEHQRSTSGTSSNRASFNRPDREAEVPFQAIRPGGQLVMRRQASSSSADDPARALVVSDLFPRSDQSLGIVCPVPTGGCRHQRGVDQVAFDLVAAPVPAQDLGPVTLVDDGLRRVDWRLVIEVAIAEVAGEHVLALDPGARRQGVLRAAHLQDRPTAEDRKEDFRVEIALDQPLDYRDRRPPSRRTS